MATSFRTLRNLRRCDPRTGQGNRCSRFIVWGLGCLVLIAVFVLIYFILKQNDFFTADIIPPASTSSNSTPSKQQGRPLPHVSVQARWKQNGITIAGGHGVGDGLHQLWNPYGLDVDEEGTIYIADYRNDRIMEWKSNATSGQVVAGRNGKGDRPDRLNYPTDVVVDRETDSLLICDRWNRRVMRWSRRSGTSGETIIPNIACSGLTMDDQGFLYVADTDKHAVRQYRLGKTSGDGTVVAGGHEEGNGLNQLKGPTYISVDRDHSVYVSDYPNHRAMKWMKNSKKGIVVAGGRGQGNHLTQLSSPGGVIVDSLGTVYVVDRGNHRVMRWYNGMTQGNVILGGNGEGEGANQFKSPEGLSFDRHGNLYVADWGNNRVQRFNIEQS